VPEMDRRKRKTRKAIFHACVELVQEKDFQSITINEIVECADLNRGTFYLHFADKYDMMNSFEDEMIEKIEHIIVKNIPEQQFNQIFIQSRYDTIVGIFTCFEENKELLQLLLKSSHGSSFQEKLHNKLAIILEGKVFPQIPNRELDIPKDLFLKIFISSLISIAEYAYQSKTSIDVEKLAKIFMNIIIHGPAKTLGFTQDENYLDL
jgi:AcrR family transcriptional regulator